MRKLLPLILFVLFAGSANAQTVSFTVISLPCDNNGILRANFSGVVPPITVTWTTQGSNGSVITHTGVSGLTDVLTSYSGGPVNFVATDSTGATDAGFFPGSAPFNYSFSIRTGVCPIPDTVSYIVAGGTAPYTAQWYNMATLAVVSTANPAILPQGSYGITIKDAAGCVYGSKVDPNFANLASVAPFTLTPVSTIANCTDGTASVTIVGGGVPPFSYKWSNGATTESLIALITGNYTVAVKDAQGCGTTASVFVPQSAGISAAVTTVAASCLDTNGAVSAVASGGTAPYTYMWSNGVTTASQAGLATGTYSLMVTDANGCIGTNFGNVGVSANPISVTHSSSPSLCISPTGNATVAVAGGVTPYFISWHTTPAQYGVTATNLIPGDYYYHVTDVNGCRREGMVTVPPVDVISLVYSPVAALCSLSTGSINITPTGGVPPYTFLWSTGATTSSLTGLPTGNYQVTVTDNLGCKTTESPYVGAYSPVTLGLRSTPATCRFANDGINTATAFGGNAPYTYAWSSGGNSSTISGLPVGPYWARVTDASGCTSDWNYSYVRADTTATSCFCTIEGTVFYDVNSNCLQDPTEMGIPNAQIYISGRGYTYTDKNGHYTYQVPAGSYNVSETIRTNYHLSVCQTNGIPVITGTGAGCINTINFANTVDTVHDMHISTWDYTAPVRGSEYLQATIITNDGTVPEDNTAAAYFADGQVFEPKFTPSRIFSGAPYQYSATGTFPTLNPGDAQQVFMKYHIPTNIPVGTPVVFRDTVAYNSPVLFWLIDNTPWNNINTFTTNISSAFAANFIEVSPKGTGAPGLIQHADSILEYMVHFQNTGAELVQNVMVIDTLDENLDWTSLKPVFMSSPDTITMQQVGTRKVATFYFKNIYLPARANNSIGSNGMFTYTIHTKAGLPAGTQYKASASVYFDYNAPEKTNTTLNTLQFAAGVTDVATSAYRTFTIYPNPASQSFNAIINSETAGDAVMIINDVTGKTMMNKTISIQKGKQTINTDASQLAPGIYFVTINDHGQVQTQKLVIMK